jgi:flavin-dependent dehydrogenase
LKWKLVVDKNLVAKAIGFGAEDRAKTALKTVLYVNNAVHVFFVDRHGG